jgi:hypothetical protein
LTKPFIATSSRTQSGSVCPRHAGLVLAALTLVAAVANLNLAVANVALPSIGDQQEPHGSGNRHIIVLDRQLRLLKAANPDVYDQSVSSASRPSAYFPAATARMDPINCAGV